MIIHLTQGRQKAELFIQDFILTQLIGKDINDMWEIVNPMGVLTDILTRQDRSLPESRYEFICRYSVCVI